MLTQSLTTESRYITSKSIQNNYFLGILIILFVFLLVINYWVNKLLCNYLDCSFSKPQSKGNITNLQFWNPEVIIALRKVSWDHSIIELRIKWFPARTDTEPVKYTRDDAPKWVMKAVSQMISLVSKSLQGFLAGRDQSSPRPRLHSSLRFPFLHTLSLPRFSPGCLLYFIQVLLNCFFSSLSLYLKLYFTFICSLVFFSPPAYSMRSSTWLFTIVTLAPNKYLLTQK